MLDGDGYHNIVNVSKERAGALYNGMIMMTSKMQKALSELGGGGEVIINSGVWCAGPQVPAPIAPGACRAPGLVVDAGSGLFDEMFGAFATMAGGVQSKTGEWDPHLMRLSFDAILNATAAGKTAFIHAFPGPSGSSLHGDMFPIRGNTTPGSPNHFMASSWAGAVRTPESAAATRTAAAERLVESLAPFLIVANKRTFLSYAWFYNIEDGYIPCPAEYECGMPSKWYPEFSRPIGEPKGPATTDPTRTIWTREFQHASVFVDLRNRSASKIYWQPTVGAL